MVPSQIVTYIIDSDASVSVEIEPIEGFVPAGADNVAGLVQSAVQPAISAARVVLERARELAPDGVEVKFGVKVTGTANWLVAKAASEGNFEVTLSWSPRRPEPDHARDLVSRDVAL